MNATLLNNIGTYLNKEASFRALPRAEQKEVVITLALDALKDLGKSTEEAYDTLFGAGEYGKLVEDLKKELAE